MPNKEHCYPQIHGAKSTDIKAEVAGHTVHVHVNGEQLIFCTLVLGFGITFAWLMGRHKPN